MVVPHLRSATPQSSTSATLALYYDIYCNYKRDLVSIVSMFFFELPAILLIRAVIAIVVVVIVIIIAIMIIIQTIRSLLLFRCCGCCSCCFIKYKEKTAPRGSMMKKERETRATGIIITLFYTAQLQGNIL